MLLGHLTYLIVRDQEIGDWARKTNVMPVLLTMVLSTGNAFPGFITAETAQSSKRNSRGRQAHGPQGQTSRHVQYHNVDGLLRPDASMSLMSEKYGIRSHAPTEKEERDGEGRVFVIYRVCVSVISG